MTAVATDLDSLAPAFPNASEVSEGNVRYVHLPRLVLPGGQVVEALLRPQAAPGDGYVTRLYLSSPVAGKGANWTVHRILDRTWHTWSWNNVLATGTLAEILAEHLRALR